MVVVNLSMFLLAAVLGWRFLRAVQRRTQQVKDAMVEELAKKTKGVEGSHSHALPKVIQDFEPFSEVGTAVLSLVLVLNITTHLPVVSMYK